MFSSGKFETSPLPIRRPLKYTNSCEELVYIKRIEKKNPNQVKYNATCIDLTTKAIKYQSVNTFYLLQINELYKYLLCTPDMQVFEIPLQFFSFKLSFTFIRTFGSTCHICQFRLANFYYNRVLKRNCLYLFLQSRIYCFLF